MYAIIRIRGNVGIKREIRSVLKMLKLDKIHRCVVVPETEDYKGVTRKVGDFAAFGKLSYDMFLEMMKKRGRLEGNKRVDEETVKQTGYSSIEQMAEGIFEGKVEMRDIPKLKPFFRLTPPSKGFISTRKRYPKGDLGDHGEDIDKLLKRMI